MATRILPVRPVHQHEAKGSKARLPQEITATLVATLLGAGLLLLTAPWWMWIVVFVGLVLTFS